MKKYFLPFTAFVLLVLTHATAQTVHRAVAPVKIGNASTENVQDLINKAIEDMSLRTPYSSTWRMSDGRIIACYSSSVINKLDGYGRPFHSLIKGNTSYWTGGSTPSCIYPNYYTDSILITIPPGIAISKFTIDYSYVTNAMVPVPMKDGVFYLSTPCGKSDTVDCDTSGPGICYLLPNNDFSNPLTSCMTPSCTSQSFWLDAHLARHAGGIGCDTDFVWYSKYNSSIPECIFAAYVEGYPIVSLTTHATADTGPCNGTAKVMASGGMPPYTYLWSPGNQTTDSISALCNGNYCCTVTDNKGCMDTVCISITNTTGIRTIGNAADINVYPNPGNGNFNITGTSYGQVIELYDYMGQKINTLTAINDNTQINITDKSNGVYLIRILNWDGSIVAQRKIIKTQ
jgi:hypothetical protein